VRRRISTVQLPRGTYGTASPMLIIVDAPLATVLSASKLFKTFASTALDEQALLR
tara:strand:- start:262 stop:426 length:165 start_codon:yes stop_codon:yes gene_type:complete